MKPLTPPAALVLAHGAGSGPWVYEDWPTSFPDLCVLAVDLHENLDVAHASHSDYAFNLARAVATVPRPVALCGWSMGGLVVLQTAAELGVHSAILIEPSPPLEAQGSDDTVELTAGTFDPVELYGAFPPGVRARPESMRARAERKRGISVPSLSCPSLVVYGDEFPDERGRWIARLYGSDELFFAGLDHWELIRDARVRTAIATYLGIL